jgi:hypothetical protein
LLFRLEIFTISMVGFCRSKKCTCHIYMQKWLLSMTNLFNLERQSTFLYGPIWFNPPKNDDNISL